MNYGNGLDNRKSNLRIVTHKQNMQNRKIHKNNKSGYKGVYKKKCGTYLAQIRANKKKYYLGSYPTAAEAYTAYCEASEKYHGDFGRVK